MTTAADATLAFVGIVVVVFPIAALADAVLGSPLGANVWLVAIAAGIVGAYPHVARDHSVKRLWRFVGVMLTSGFGWLVVVGAAMSVAGVAVPAGDRRPFLYATLLAVATSYVTVYSDAVDVPSPSGDTSSVGNSP